MAQKSKPSLKTWNFSGSRLILNVRILARRGRLTSHPGRTATAAVRNAFPMSLCWNRLRKALPFPLLPSLPDKDLYRIYEMTLQRIRSSGVAQFPCLQFLHEATFLLPSETKMLRWAERLASVAKCYVTRPRLRRQINNSPFFLFHTITA